MPGNCTRFWHRDGYLDIIHNAFLRVRSHESQNDARCAHVGGRKAASSMPRTCLQFCSGLAPTNHVCHAPCHSYLRQNPRCHMLVSIREEDEQALTTMGCLSFSTLADVCYYQEADRRTLHENEGLVSKRQGDIRPRRCPRVGRYGRPLVTVCQPAKQAL